MTTHERDDVQFFFTADSPCPYLDNRDERKLFTYLRGARADVLHHLLANHGFRRSQSIVYRPSCVACDACQAVRVVTREFTPSRRQKRIQRCNRDIVATGLAPLATDEQYDVFRRYLATRHPGGGMTEMSYLDYALMVEDTPVETVLIEYRLAEPGSEGRLAGIALSDVMADGLSMVYSFFDPDFAGRSLGNLMILDHIARAPEMGLDFVYLGYLIPQSPKMAYKAEFGPLEVQSDASGWRRWCPN